MIIGLASRTAYSCRRNHRSAGRPGWSVNHGREERLWLVSGRQELFKARWPERPAVRSSTIVAPLWCRSAVRIALRLT